MTEQRQKKATSRLHSRETPLKLVLGRRWDDHRSQCTTYRSVKTPKLALPEHQEITSTLDNADNLEHVKSCAWVISVHYEVFDGHSNWWMKNWFRWTRKPSSTRIYKARSHLNSRLESNDKWIYILCLLSSASCFVKFATLEHEEDVNLWSPQVPCNKCWRYGMNDRSKKSHCKRRNISE